MGLGIYVVDDLVSAGKCHGYFAVYPAFSRRYKLAPYLRIDILYADDDKAAVYTAAADSFELVVHDLALHNKSVIVHERSSVFDL